QRVEPETVRSYMQVQPGDPFDSDRVDQSLKSLFATGLFADVTLRREGNALIVRVVENPIINRIAFEGNHKLSDETLTQEVQLNPRPRHPPPKGARHRKPFPPPPPPQQPFRRPRRA